MRTTNFSNTLQRFGAAFRVNNNGTLLRFAVFFKLATLLVLGADCDDTEMLIVM